MATKIITVAATPPAESSGADYNKGAPLNATEFDQNLINLRAAVDRRALASSSEALTVGALTATTLNCTTTTSVGITSIFNSATTDNTTNTYLNLIKKNSKAWSIGNVLHTSSRDLVISDDENGGGTVRLCITEAGTVLIGTATAATGAKLEVVGSITATTGMKFGNTAVDQGQTLDWYEEGEVTVAMTPTSGSITLSGNKVAFTRIGNRVYLNGLLTVSAVSSPRGMIQITGLPYASNSAALGWSSFSMADNLSVKTKGCIGAASTRITYSKSDDSECASLITTWYSCIVSGSYIV